jgi:hypothetical protein
MKASSNSTLTKRKGPVTGEQIKNSAPNVEDADAKPYQPTEADARALKAYTAAQARGGPRLKIAGSVVGFDHPDSVFGQLSLLKAIGSTDNDFLNGLIKQLVNVGSPGSSPDEDGANFMLAIIKGIEPRDQVEAMLAAQIAAVHNATMTFARRLAHVENIPQQDSAERAFNKLARTFAAQVEALKRYRSGGEQKMTVQHVHVAEGGQAIVGNVSAPAPGVGANEKMKEQPHALGYAPGVEMPRQVEENREAMPITGGAGP